MARSSVLEIIFILLVVQERIEPRSINDERWVSNKAGDAKRFSDTGNSEVYIDSKPNKKLKPYKDVEDHEDVAPLAENPIIMSAVEDKNVEASNKNSQNEHQGKIYSKPSSRGGNRYEKKTDESEPIAENANLNVAENRELANPLRSLEPGIDTDNEMQVDDEEQEVALPLESSDFEEKGTDMQSANVASQEEQDMVNPSENQGNYDDMPVEQEQGSYENSLQDPSMYSERDTNANSVRKRRVNDIVPQREKISGKLSNKNMHYRHNSASNLPSSNIAGKSIHKSGKISGQSVDNIIAKPNSDFVEVNEEMSDDTGNENALGKTNSRNSVLSQEERSSVTAGSCMKLNNTPAKVIRSAVSKGKKGTKGDWRSQLHGMEHSERQEKRGSLVNRGISIQEGPTRNADVKDDQIASDSQMEIDEQNNLAYSDVDSRLNEDQVPEIDASAGIESENYLNSDTENSQADASQIVPDDIVEEIHKQQHLSDISIKNKRPYLTHAQKRNQELQQPPQVELDHGTLSNPKQLKHKFGRGSEKSKDEFQYDTDEKHGQETSKKSLEIKQSKGKFEDTNDRSMIDPNAEESMLRDDKFVSLQDERGAHSEGSENNKGGPVREDESSEIEREEPAVQGEDGNMGEENAENFENTEDKSNEDHGDAGDASEEKVAEVQKNADDVSSQLDIQEMHKPPREAAGGVDEVAQNKFEEDEFGIADKDEGVIENVEESQLDAQDSGEQSDSDRTEYLDDEGEISKYDDLQGENGESKQAVNDEQQKESDVLSKREVLTGEKRHTFQNKQETNKITDREERTRRSAEIYKEKGASRKELNVQAGGHMKIPLDIPNNSPLIPYEDQLAAQEENQNFMKELGSPVQPVAEYEHSIEHAVLKEPVDAISPIHRRSVRENNKKSGENVIKQSIKGMKKEFKQNTSGTKSNPDFKKVLVTLKEQELAQANLLDPSLDYGMMESHSTIRKRNVNPELNKPNFNMGIKESEINTNTKQQQTQDAKTKLNVQASTSKDSANIHNDISKGKTEMIVSPSKFSGPGDSEFNDSGIYERTSYSSNEHHRKVLPQNYQYNYMHYIRPGVIKYDQIIPVDSNEVPSYTNDFRYNKNEAHLAVNQREGYDQDKSFLFRAEDSLLFQNKRGEPDFQYDDHDDDVSEVHGTAGLFNKKHSMVHLQWPLVSKKTKNDHTKSTSSQQGTSQNNDNGNPFLEHSPPSSSIENDHDMVKQYLDSFGALPNYEADVSRIKRVKRQKALGSLQDVADLNENG